MPEKYRRHGERFNYQTAQPVRATRKVARKCQANIGTEGDPRSCGQDMRKVNDWTFRCPEHGEMH